MLNCWIPICGVNQNTGLLLFQDPTTFGTRNSKNQLNFRGKKIFCELYKIMENKNELKLINPNYGEMILFSSHLTMV